MKRRWPLFLLAVCLASLVAAMLLAMRQRPAEDEFVLGALRDVPVVAHAAKGRYSERILTGRGTLAELRSRLAGLLGGRTGWRPSPVGWDYLPPGSTLPWLQRQRIHIALSSGEAVPLGQGGHPTGEWRTVYLDTWPAEGMPGPGLLQPPWSISAADLFKGQGRVATAATWSRLKR